MIYGTIAPTLQEAQTMNERQEQNMSAWMTVREAAAALGVSDRRIRQMLGGDTPELHGIRVGEGRRGIWLVERQSVEAARNRPGAWRKAVD